MKVRRFVNVILIFSDTITLIDTGVKGSTDQIFDYIKMQNRNYSEITKIVLSHSHPDHIGNAAEIKNLTGCRVYAHENEKEWIENIKLQNEQRPVPGFFNLVDQPVILDELLSHNQIITIDRETSLRIIHSPGHSRGSVNIHFIEDRVLFTADSIPVKGDIPNYDNYRDILQSIEEINKMKGYDILLTSWTPMITDPGKIRKLLQEGEEYILQIDKTVREIYQDAKVPETEKCRLVIEKLGLPQVFINPITERTFRRHL